jgi:hypothetical protein
MMHWGCTVMVIMPSKQLQCSKKVHCYEGGDKLEARMAAHLTWNGCKKCCISRAVGGTGYTFLNEPEEGGMLGVSERIMKFEKVEVSWLYNLPCSHIGAKRWLYSNLGATWGGVVNAKPYPLLTPGMTWYPLYRRASYTAYVKVIVKYFFVADVLFGRSS